MNILFFTRSFYPKIGGVENHVLAVSIQLLREGHTVSVVTESEIPSQLKYFKPSSYTSQEETFHGIHIYRIPISISAQNKKFTIWNWLIRNRNLIKEADIIHAHDVGYWFFPFKILSPRKRFYTTFHGYETVFPPRMNAVVIRRITKLLSYKTINIGNYIEKWYGTKSDLTIYGGVSLTKLNATVKVKNQLSLLFIGRIEEDNGVYIYEEVLKILDNNHINYTFSALGDGSLRKLFERFGKVHGFVEKTSSFVRNADVLFASSYLSILEGFASNKTVMSVYQNQLKKDYLLMTPFSKWIVSSDEAMVIAHAIIALSEGKNKYDENKEKAYEWVKNQTWDKVTEEYESLWSK